MSEPKFTPGPWYIGTPPPNNEQTIGTKDGMMVAVATTGVNMVGATLANANLIAAAPELYEALEECAIDLKGWILGRYPEESLKYPSIKKDFELDISIVDKAFAALAKARGER